MVCAALQNLQSSFTSGLINNLCNQSHDVAEFRYACKGSGVDDVKTFAIV